MEIPEPGVRRSLRLHLPELFPIAIHRLMDHELDALASEAQAVPQEQRWMPLSRSLDLASVFLAAEAVFGRSSTRFDDFKGSFSFPLLLVPSPETSASTYLGALHDRRCSIELELHPLTGPATCHSSTDGPPMPRDLSDAELDSLRDTVLGFLSDAGSALARGAPPFVRTVDSELWIYGCRGGQTFARQADSADELSQLVRAIESEIGASMQQQHSRHVAGILDDVTRGVIRQR